MSGENPSTRAAGMDSSPRGTARDAAPDATASARELLVALVKAQKARRLYQGASPALERQERDLISRLGAFHEAHGALSLTIREFQILSEDQVVYENKNRTESLAFALFRDGLRRLSIDPGVPEAEVQALLECLARAAAAAGHQQDDVVTLLWEQDFTGIHYFAVEELSPEGDGERLAQQLASGSLDSGGSADPARGGATDAVSIQDLEQPVARLPIHECHLSEAEHARLQADLRGEGEHPFWVRAVELAVELMLLETSTEDRDALFRCLVGLVDQRLAEGELEAVVGIPEHLDGLGGVFGDAAELRALQRRLVGALAERDRLERFLELARGRRDLAPAQLASYLARLGEAGIDTVVDWLPRMPGPQQRRALARALAATGEAAARRLVGEPVAGADAPPPDLLREILFVVDQLPAPRRLAPLETLLRSPHASARREAVRLLGRLRDAAAHRSCLRLLADADPEVRGSALDTLVRHERRDLAGDVLAAALGGEGFTAWTAAEKRRLFTGVAKLGGDDALDAMAEPLRRKDRRWFASRSDRDLLEAAAHGIRMVGSPRAHETLRELAASADRQARSACQRELDAMGGGR